MEAAGLVFNVIALFSSAIELTQYAIDRERKLFVWSNTDCMVGGISQSSQKQNVGLEHVRELLKICERTLSFEPEELAQCRQLIRSKQPWARRSIGSDAGRVPPFRDLAGRCEKLVSCWQSGGGQKEPVFWKLQRWIVHPGKTVSHLLGIQIPEALRQPSPNTLLISWLVVTIATIAYYEYHPRHRYRKAILLSSAIVAAFIGTIEGSNIDTMLLTNVPWCVALGILLDLLVHGFISIESRKTTITGSSTREEIYAEKDQKIAM